MTAEPTSLGTELDAGQMFGERVKNSLPMLRRYCYAVTGDTQDGDDLIQDTCVQAQRSFDRYDAGRDFGAWMRGIARNVARQRQREWAKRARVEVSLDEEIVSRMEALYRSEASTGPDVRDLLERCLQKLPGHHRDLVTSMYVHGRKLRELARDSGRTLSWAKMTLLRIRRALADCIFRHRTQGTLQ